MIPVNYNTIIFNKLMEFNDVKTNVKCKKMYLCAVTSYWCIQVLFETSTKMLKKLKFSQLVVCLVRFKILSIKYVVNITRIS